MSTTRTPSDLWRRGQHGWPASYPVVQLPNAPLLAALGGWLAAALTDSSTHGYGRATFYTGLAAWAWEELTDGANLLRRALGAAGLGYVIVNVGRGLGA
ncbi:MAG: hypothetical protein JSS99_11330 [Actinobacteria bacterium]|nr:hypothetical protein [Actinomycetota bacterium]